jgi:hypothetical protein
MAQGRSPPLCAPAAVLNAGLPRRRGAWWLRHGAAWRGMAPPDLPSAPKLLRTSPPGPPQLSMVVADGMRLVSTFSHDELVMAVVALFPLIYGTLAALRWMSGAPTATAMTQP